MKPGFEQTNDLVRFRVRCTPEANRDLSLLNDALTGAGHEWFALSVGGGSVDGLVYRSFIVPSVVAFRVLDVLAKHGVERAQELG